MANGSEPKSGWLDRLLPWRQERRAAGAEWDDMARDYPARARLPSRP